MKSYYCGVKTKSSTDCGYNGFKFNKGTYGECRYGRLVPQNDSVEYFEYEAEELPPCPKCNSAKWLKTYRHDFISKGEKAGIDGKAVTLLDLHNVPDSIANQPGALKKIYRWLKRGNYKGLKNQQIVLLLKRRNKRNDLSRTH